LLTLPGGLLCAQERLGLNISTLTHCRASVRGECHLSDYDRVADGGVVLSQLSLLGCDIVGVAIVAVGRGVGLAAAFRSAAEGVVVDACNLLESVVLDLSR